MPVSPKEMGEKPCEHCGSSMHRRHYGARLEDAGAFKRRRFCSLSCANSQEKGGDSLTTYRRRAGRARKTACERCSKGHRRLHVHHLDENPANNDPVNLITLCPSCHRLCHARPRTVGRSLTLSR